MVEFNVVNVVPDIPRNAEDSVPYKETKLAETVVIHESPVKLAWFIGEASAA